MGAHARIPSLPGFAELPGGDRITAYIRAVWPTFRELAFYATGSRELGRGVAYCGIAHTGAETAHGASLSGWNVGNVTAPAGARDWFQATDTYPVPAPGGGTMDVVQPVRFRWFSTLRAGVTDYLLTISKPRYLEAWRLALDGSSLFLPELRKAGYFSGRSYVHPGESIARVDSDAELEAMFRLHLARVAADVDALEGGPTGRARRRAVAGTILVGLAGSSLAQILLR